MSISVLMLYIIIANVLLTKSTDKITVCPTDEYYQQE
jgi:hypothetical protein